MTMLLMMQSDDDLDGTDSTEAADDEARVTAMKAQEEIREVNKEVGEMRTKMKSLEELQ